MISLTDKQVFTAVLYTKEDAERLLRENPGAGKVYPLTPDAKAALLCKTNLTILDPLNFFTDYSHRRVIAEAKAIERTLYPLIDHLDELTEAEKKTFRNIFHPSISSALYIWNSLRGSGPWLVFNGKEWIKTDRQLEAFSILFRRIVRMRRGVFSLAKTYQYQFGYIVHLLNSLILKTLPDNILWTTGPSYGMQNLGERIQEKQSNTAILHLDPADVFSVARAFKTLLYRVFSKDSGSIGITPVRSSITTSRTVVKKAIDAVEHSVLDEVSEPLIDFLTGCIDYTKSIVPYVKQLFSKKRPKVFLAWHLRWFGGAVLGEVAKSQKVPSILISHGSHPIPADASAFYELEHLARGLLFSPLASETIVQSPQADQSVELFMPELKRNPNQPIMWGWKMNNFSLSHNKTFRILHAGTYKLLCARPWIYETSNEFVYGLQQLINSVRIISNTELIIRIRSAPECSVSSLDKLLPDSINCHIKTDGNFQDDLDSADLVVSFSSTTIDEALYAGKPVALFGGSERYRHLLGSSKLPDGKNRSAVYHISQKNIDEMLHAIIAAHKNEPLTEEELSDYIWPKPVPDHNAFISDIISPM